ncbi:Transcription factor ILR3 [Acorus calamus]|uniref:Transcription factor ILR3 n=1 Tax=Acorus calamus TaxID=4465 RepID=A0AAV9DVF7_ACOCL|nr:Transcription factor ILR3 [Acorus calamus]
MGSPENPNFYIDFSGIDDFTVDGGDLPEAAGTGIYWPSQGLFNASSNVSLDNNSGFEDSNGIKDSGSRKRVRSESCSVSGSKACREKMRRDRLNDRFMELGSILEPGKPPKMDKAAILSDAVRMVTQLRGESQKLKESNESLQEKIKELKAEKNELRDEKQRLKAEKESLEHQIKAMTLPPSFIPHPPVIPAAYAAAQGQGALNKLMPVPFMGYPGVAMWQLMPPAAVDTSEDPNLHPPVA